MGRRLNATVYLRDENDVVLGFGPGDIVPDWVAEQITNPDVWEDDNEESTADDEPPRTGKGSGRDAWVAFAESLGITVPEDAGRDDIIELVDNHQYL